MDGKTAENGKNGLYLRPEPGQPVFLWLTGKGGSGEAERLREAAGGAVGLFAFEAEDWDAAYSPWSASMTGGRFFAGAGEKTLEQLTEEVLPLIRRDCGGPVYLAGYSLAGLFALWSLYRTELFDGAVCCSGSLWFPGWSDFAASPAAGPCRVYLSLGGKEARTKDPLMAGIERETKAQYLRMKKDPRVRAITLEMVPGGHFSDSVKRLARGMRRFAENNAATSAE